jgi:predicted lipid-binding transport protein (Tim44 family)
MKQNTRTFINSLVLISLALGTINAAEAKRLGGGKSFGSKSTYSAPMKRADLPPSANRTAAPPANSTAPAPLPNRQQPQPQSNGQAWKDRAMGAAAGLAVGGLVGSMMGGNEQQHAPAPQPAQPQNYAPQPQQGYAQPQAPQYVEQPQQGYAQPAPMQQAPQYAPAPMVAQPQQGYAQPMPYADNTGATKSSGGFSFFNLLLLAGLGYLAYRFFFAKKNQTPAPISQPSYQRASAEPAYSAPIPSGGSSADFDTDIMFKKGESTISSSTVNLAKARDTQTPANFDTAQFLDEVKNRYMALQQAWDARDFAEIRGLTTDKVFAEIQEQLKGSNEQHNTDVLKLDADLLEIRELNVEFEAVVLFDAIMREDVAGQANQVREVWHFVKAKSGFNANWLLDGIQQLED